MMYKHDDTLNQVMEFRIYRDNVVIPNTGMTSQQGVADFQQGSTFTWIDEPNTQAAVKYELWTMASGGTWELKGTSGGGNCLISAVEV